MKEKADSERCCDDCWRNGLKDWGIKEANGSHEALQIVARGSPRSHERRGRGRNGLVAQAWLRQTERSGLRPKALCSEQFRTVQNRSEQLEGPERQATLERLDIWGQPRA